MYLHDEPKGYTEKMEVAPSHVSFFFDPPSLAVVDECLDVRRRRWRMAFPPPPLHVPFSAAALLTVARQWALPSRVSSIILLTLVLRFVFVLVYYAPPLLPQRPDWTETFTRPHQRTSSSFTHRIVVAPPPRPTFMQRAAGELPQRRRIPPEEENDSDAILVSWDWWYYLENIVSTMWTGNLFCDLIQEKVAQASNATGDVTAQNRPLPKIVFSWDLVCADAYKQSGYGTGNFIQAMYMMRTVLRYVDTARVKVIIVCRDADALQRDFVMPWYTGTWYSSNYWESSGFIAPPSPLPPALYCGNFTVHPTALVVPEMQYDARRMAVALLGSALMHSHHRHAPPMKQFVQDYIYENGSANAAAGATDGGGGHGKQMHLSWNQDGPIPAGTTIRPLIEAHVELDDAVIHFRCGDLLSIYLTNYGFMMFDGYSRHISPEVRTIGILTQPFCKQPPQEGGADVLSSVVANDQQQRSLDGPNCERCEILVLALVQHLQERFPHAQVSVRNDPAVETIALAYTRIVLANQSIAAMSTFSLFPMIATFGTGYFRRPQGLEPSVWMSHPEYSIDAVMQNQSNIVLFDEPQILVAVKAKELWEGHGSIAVLDWFRTGRYPEGFYH